MGLLEDLAFGVGGYLIGKNVKKEPELTINGLKPEIENFIKSISISEFLELKYKLTDMTTYNIHEELIRLLEKY